MLQLVSLILIPRIVIYPVDSAIQLLNNWGQECYFDKNSLDDRLRLTRHGQASRHVSVAFDSPGGVIIVKHERMYSSSIWLCFSNWTHLFSIFQGPLAHEFSAQEVRGLIRALFQNTDRRAAVLAKIKPLQG